ncbi:DUF4422 domain-containing protein [Paraburkholderia lycopersici]|uniref:DUF4422 domain-containing protein n=1 Tax=Paraburkholderia lycopersici TaxID=416944 RepID=A0A1G6T629_9BURK|nr:DUF4422 domain-containing protein [Paraburkholderia lycopersici]SDD24471.1 protein of unknown function [Paraburkholderia lycopersici]
MSETASPSLKIYQTFHKDFYRNTGCEWIVPVGVNGYDAPGLQRDCEGENIAELNPYYNELTAYYWAWKNSEADIVGFYHYRRYLNFLIDETWKDRLIVATPAEARIVEYLTHAAQCERARRMLNVCDVVLPRTLPAPRSIEDHYLGHHHREPWDAFLTALESAYPEHRAHLDLFRLTGVGPICNIFVMRRPLFDEYCAELFPIIDPIFKQIGPRYDAHGNRFPGFLAERFLAFWVHIRRLRTLEVPLIQLT